MAVKLKIKDLAPGTVFNAGPIDVRVLEHTTDGTTLVIADTCIANRHFADQPFKLRPEKPEHNPNDWRFSSLRKELNTDFLEAFNLAEGPIRSSNIKTEEWNLEDHNGGEGYGVIRIADLCGHLGIDLEAAIVEKMTYNEGREYKHGKQF